MPNMPILLLQFVRMMTFFVKSNNDRNINKQDLSENQG